MGYGDYLRFSKLVFERYGLHFPDSRRADLERGVRQAFAASTCTDLNEYYSLLQDPDSNVMHFERLVNAITINETHFFRDAGQVDALYSHVLPHLISRRRALRTLRIWSAGCASGEEPYSIAMLHPMTSMKSFPKQSLITKLSKGCYTKTLLPAN